MQLCMENRGQLWDVFPQSLLLIFNLYLFMYGVCVCVQVSIEARGGHLVSWSITVFIIPQDRVSRWSWSSAGSRQVLVILHPTMLGSRHRHIHAQLLFDWLLFNVSSKLKVLVLVQQLFLSTSPSPSSLPRLFILLEVRSLTEPEACPFSQLLASSCLHLLCWVTDLCCHTQAAFVF